MNVAHQKLGYVGSPVNSNPLENINKSKSNDKHKDKSKHKKNNTNEQKNNKKKNIKSILSFLCFLLSCTSFASPLKAMYGENDRDKIPDWHGIFTTPQHGKMLGTSILNHLDESSLRNARQVSKGWHHMADRITYSHLDHEKQQLYALILEVTGAEPNEVQRAHDQLENYLKTSQEQGKDKTDLCQSLRDLKPRLVQPEFLIRGGALFNQLLESKDLQKNHAALNPLVKMIEDLQGLLTLSDLQPILLPLICHYEIYLQHLLSPVCNRSAHLHPKALLSGEAFLGAQNKNDKNGITSYRISQEMARSLLSKDEYGLSAKTNARGSHAVCFKRSNINPTKGVHFKGNTTNTGLPVGRESAVYALSQVLFPENAFCGRTSVSSLLSLNEVEINTPVQGTEVSKAFREALNFGQTSEEFFTHFPHYEKEFTQKDPQHVVQASFHVEGISLEDFIHGVDKNTYTYDAIDLASFSDHIFLSMLINPTDGTPGNFMLRKNDESNSNENTPDENHSDENKTDERKDKKTKDKTREVSFSIVGIDNDMAFEVGDIFVENVPSQFVPGQKITTQQKHSVRVKNVLYCLPLMDLPLSPQTVKRILSLNPELIVLQWCERLKEQHLKYDQLLKGVYATSNVSKPQEAYVSPPQIEDLHLPFLLDPAFIPTFCQTIRNIQAYLKDHPASSHWQLL